MYLGQLKHNLPDQYLDENPELRAEIYSPEWLDCRFVFRRTYACADFGMRLHERVNCHGMELNPGVAVKEGKFLFRQWQVSILEEDDRIRIYGAGSTPLLAITNGVFAHLLRKAVI